MPHSSATAGEPASERLPALIEGQLRALVLDTPFPCAGAKSALRNGGYVFGGYADMRSERSLHRMATDLRHFVRIRHDLGNFYTFIGSFIEPAIVPDERSWDVLVWDCLQRLHDMDTDAWDDRWATDPADANFAFSF